MMPTRFSIGALVISIFIIDSIIPLGVSGGVAYILPILLSLYLKDRQFTLALATTGTVLTILGMWTSPPGEEMLWKVMGNRALAIFAIWTCALLTTRLCAHVTHLMKEQERAEQDKRRIFKATLASTQHIMNNLLNQLVYIQESLRVHPELKENHQIMRGIIAEGDELMHRLADVQTMDESHIRCSVMPGEALAKKQQAVGALQLAS